MQDLFNPGTWLNCDINNMTEKEFISYCREEYRRTHNIPPPSQLTKKQKEFEEAFIGSIQTKEQKKPNGMRIRTKAEYFKSANYVKNNLRKTLAKLAILYTFGTYKGNNTRKLGAKEKDSIIPILETYYKTAAETINKLDEKTEAWKNNRHRSQKELPESLKAKDLKNWLLVNVENPEEAGILTELCKTLLTTTSINWGTEKKEKNIESYNIYHIDEIMNDFKIIKNQQKGKKGTP